MQNFCKAFKRLCLIIGTAYLVQVIAIALPLQPLHALLYLAFLVKSCWQAIQKANRHTYTITANTLAAGLPSI